MEARKANKNWIFFYFGLCIMELETLYLTLCKILRKIKTLAVYQLFTFSVPVAINLVKAKKFSSRFF